jgi:hypothetical protein
MLYSVEMVGGILIANAVTSKVTLAPFIGSIASSVVESVGSATWTDGSRVFNIATNTLVSNGTRTNKKISDLESAVFNSKMLYSVEMVGGILTIRTQDKALCLK